MMRENKRTLMIASIVTLLPIVIGVIFWNRLPDVMATHFGTDNEANGFSSKAFTVFGIPLICLALLWAGAWVTAHDPRKQYISPKMYRLVLWIVPVISLIVVGTIYPYNLGYEMDIMRISQLVIGILFVIIGNYLPKARRNYTIGIRIPWTLANEENWNRTHRIGGYLWVIGGLFMIIMALTGLGRAGWSIGLIVVIALVPCIYSCWMHVKCGL